MTKLDQLAEIGQAIWLDYIRRAFIASGEMQKLIAAGLRGMTSNPSIFEKAIAGNDDYDADLERLVPRGLTPLQIFEHLAIDDIRQAADLLLPVYRQTQGGDGYVSLEVNPNLAYDAQKTLSEAKRLWSEVDRPNLMIKIPATEAGLPAISAAIAAGINVNVTLIFSLVRYHAVMEAYLAGLETRLEAGQSLAGIASVASFFVSRVDTKVDKRLAAIIQSEGKHTEAALSLQGKAAVANAKLAYSLFQSTFQSERFTRLAQAGANYQRPLWASTSTKNPAYSDILYVQELIGAHTVNTLPQKTLDAFLDHGEVRLTIEDGVTDAQAAIDQIESLGISMAQVTQELEEEGVSAFARSFASLLESIREKCQTINARQPLALSLGKYHDAFQQTLASLETEKVLPRIWQEDYTVWAPKPDEISNRLGWLHIAEEMQQRLGQIEAVVHSARHAGYTQAVLLGMGGSSLAPELFGRTFSNQAGFLDLFVLDSTDPFAVKALAEQLNPSQTLFIVSTKSGGTVETLSFFKYFYNWIAGRIGSADPGEHFIAITDPGSALVEIAHRYHFRATFLNDPNIGGRYSALSYFGLVPAALTGVDLEKLLARATQAAGASAANVPAGHNPATLLGAALSSLAGAGRDKITFLLPQRVASFGDWAEQLLAESTGKDGRGLLPVAGEPLGDPQVYGPDRVFVAFQLPGSDQPEKDNLKALQAAGHPVIRVSLTDIFDLGGQFFLWELATAVAGHVLKINPFDQPDVEAAKVLARQMVAAYDQSGSLPAAKPQIVQAGVEVYGAPDGAQKPAEALKTFLAQAKPGDYLALQGFITPNQVNRSALESLRLQLRNITRLATTLGIGPRFLHSTGQLHKGDAGNGLFIQFTASPQPDLPIPAIAGEKASSISFGVLKMAQALGDGQALQAAGRRVLRFHFTGDPAKGIHSLRNSL